MACAKNLWISASPFEGNKIKTKRVQNISCIKLGKIEHSGLQRHESQSFVVSLLFKPQGGAGI